MIKSLTIFSGSSSRELADAICRYVEIAPGRAEVTKFSDGESYVEIGENVVVGIGSGAVVGLGVLTGETWLAHAEIAKIININAFKRPELLCNL